METSDFGYRVQVWSWESRVGVSRFGLKDAAFRV